MRAFILCLFTLSLCSPVYSQDLNSSGAVKVSDSVEGYMRDNFRVTLLSSVDEGVLKDCALVSYIASGVLLNGGEIESSVDYMSLFGVFSTAAASGESNLKTFETPFSSTVLNGSVTGALSEEEIVNLALGEVDKCVSLVDQADEKVMSNARDIVSSSKLDKWGQNSDNY